MDTTGFTGLKYNRIRKLANDNAPELCGLRKLRDILDEIIANKGYETVCSYKLFEGDGEYIYRLNYLIDRYAVDANIGNTTLFNFDDMQDLDNYAKREVDLIPDVIMLDNYDKLGYEIIVLESLATTLIYAKADDGSDAFMTHDIQFWFKAMIRNKRSATKSPTSR